MRKEITPESKPANIAKIPDNMYIPSYKSKDHTVRERDLCHQFKVHVDKFKSGELDTAPNPSSMMTKLHGCRHCPYYGSTMCYHYTEVVPPRVHLNRICVERWSEIMSYAVQSESYNGKVARRTEILEKLGNHIIRLESNFADYHQKRLATITEQGKIDLGALSSDQMKFDGYEMDVMGQIHKLSMVLSDQLLGEMKINSKATAPKPNFQQFNLYLQEAAKGLNKIKEAEKIGLED